MQEEISMIVFGMIFTENSREKKKRVWVKSWRQRTWSISAVHVNFTLCYAMTASIFHHLAFWLDIVFLHMLISRACACLSSGFPHTSLNMFNIYDFLIGAAPTFYQSGSDTLNTPRTKGKSDKIICTTIKLIGTLLGLSEGVKSAQNQPDYLLVCIQHWH